MNFLSPSFGDVIFQKILTLGNTNDACETIKLRTLYYRSEIPRASRKFLFSQKLVWIYSSLAFTIFNELYLSSRDHVDFLFIFKPSRAIKQIRRKGFSEYERIRPGGAVK